MNLFHLGHVPLWLPGKIPHERSYPGLTIRISLAICRVKLFQVCFGNLWSVGRADAVILPSIVFADDVQLAVSSPLGLQAPAFREFVRHSLPSILLLPFALP